MKYVISYEILPEHEGKNGAAIMRAIKFAVPYIAGNLGSDAKDGALAMVSSLGALSLEELEKRGAECAAAAKNFDLMAECILGFMIAKTPELEGTTATGKDALQILKGLMDAELGEVHAEVKRKYPGLTPPESE